MIRRIKVGMGSCGIAAGADEVFSFLKENAAEHEIVPVGCIGHCYAEPIVEIETDEGHILYHNAKAEKNFLDNVLSLSEEGRANFSKDRMSREELRVTRLAGRIDPVSIDEYITHGGYEALRKAQEKGRNWVVDEVKRSGLRGRGGGGFPTGMKWEFLSAKETKEKILICNADEGDPGAFMDRSLMESVPHQVIEGMLIAAYATGATKLFIYCRAEYPLAIRHLSEGIRSIEERGLNIVDGRKIPIIIKEGAGAFVCGEETAMIHSLEGHRGTPRFRPPYPTDSGYKGWPSLINNVETFGNVPLIINMESDAYGSVGTEKSKGTKLFALAGDLKYPGLVEVPMGISIRDIVYGIGGAEEGSVKAVQVGGPSGGCIPEELFDTPVDYDSLNSLGAIMGSGGLIVIGKNRCMVETARYFLEFTERESCGKCTFCRIGTKRMFETLERITRGEGTEGDIALLEDLGQKITKGSLCGLGQTAPNPVLATLKYFMDEYRAHVDEKKCPALECNNLTDVYIDNEACISCKLCIKNCPVDAISDDFVVENTVCTRCNSCIELCPVNAIARVERGGSDE